MTEYFTRDEARALAINTAKVEALVGITARLGPGTTGVCFVQRETPFGSGQFEVGVAFYARDRKRRNYRVARWYTKDQFRAQLKLV